MGAEMVELLLGEVFPVTPELGALDLVEDQSVILSQMKPLAEKLADKTIKAGISDHGIDGPVEVGRVGQQAVASLKHVSAGRLLPEQVGKAGRHLHARDRFSFRIALVLAQVEEKR